MPDPNSFRGDENLNRESLYNMQRTLPPELQPGPIEALGFMDWQMPQGHSGVIAVNPYDSPPDYQGYIKKEAQRNPFITTDMIGELERMFLSGLFDGKMPATDTQNAEAESKRKQEEELRRIREQEETARKHENSRWNWLLGDSRGAE